MQTESRLNERRRLALALLAAGWLAGCASRPASVSALHPGMRR